MSDGRVWVHYRGMDMSRRPDGRVDAYAAGGYRIYEWDELLPHVQQLIEQKEAQRDDENK